MSVLFFPFDGTSNKRGSAASATKLYNISKHGFPRIPSQIIGCQNLDLTILSQLFPHLYNQLNPIALVGGEHSLTYFSFLEMKKRYHDQRLKLVVLDAHHDAYENQPLSHYSFIEWLYRQHNIEILILGLRYESEMRPMKISAISIDRLTSGSWEKMIKNFLKDDPFYLSVDVDVIDPLEFKSVGFPVKDGLSLKIFEKIYRFLLEQQPVFMDLVEFHISGSHENEESLKLLSWLDMYCINKINL